MGEGRDEPAVQTAVPSTVRDRRRKPVHGTSLVFASDLARGIREAQRHDSRAVDALLTVLRPRLVAFFAHRVARDVAEDLAQVALLRLTHALDRIEPDGADRFIATIARNLLRSAFHRSARERSLFTGFSELAGRGKESAGGGRTPEQVATEDDVSTRVEAEELARSVAEVSARLLSPELREIVLRLLDGESAAEIALRQRVSPITVRTRLLRARAILRRELGDYLDERDG